MRAAAWPLTRAPDGLSTRATRRVGLADQTVRQTGHELVAPNCLHAPNDWAEGIKRHRLTARAGVYRWLTPLSAPPWGS